MITKAQWCNHHAEGKGDACSQEHHQGEGKSNVIDTMSYIEINANSSQSESVPSNWKKRLWN